MPTPDSSSTDVFLIHELGLGRCFWAYWPRQSDLQALHFPKLQAVSEMSPESLREDLLSRFPDASELELSADSKRQLYRQIQRAILPDAVRDKIAAALKVQRGLQEEEYVQVGFSPDDLLSLKALKMRYRELARQAHPDRGGDPERFKVLQSLYERARRRLRAQSARMR